MRFLKRRGQSMGEYAVLFAIVLGAVVGLQGVIRGAIRNKIGGAFVAYNGVALSGNIAGGGTTSTSVSLTSGTANASNVSSASRSNQTF